MIIVTLVNSIILMAILMLIGFYLRNKNILNDDAESAFTYILINITTPAMVINTLVIDFSIEQFKTGLTLLFVAVLFDLFLILLGNIAAIKSGDKEKKKIIKYSIALMNGGFMGYPIINQMFGAEGMFYATMFHTPNIIFMWTYGMAVLLDGKKDRARYKQMFLNTGMIGVYIGLFIYFSQIHVPLFATNLLGLLTNVTTVLSMIIIGSKIATIGVSNSFVDKEAYYTTFWRLIISPVIMLILLKYLNFDEMIEQIYLIYSALPVAVLMPIMAKKYGSDDAFASKVVVITHLVSLMTIPIFVLLYTIL